MLSDEDICAIKVEGLGTIGYMYCGFPPPIFRAIARAAEEVAWKQIGEWLEGRWVSYTENQIDGSERRCFNMSEEEWTALREGKEMDIGMPVPPHVDHALAREVEE